MKPKSSFAKTTAKPVTPASTAKTGAEAQWVDTHVSRYVKTSRRYLAYETFLNACLAEICALVAPMAVVSVRAKTIPSMAEKILRKRKLYQDPANPLPPDPLVRMTDLCGGRVIAETAEEVNAICAFIERAFDIDRENSEDVSRRLKPAEFGYRSVHYIIMANRDKLANAGIKTPVPRQILKRPGDFFPLKAEIQVRTLLEHAWSDLGHDLLYKSPDMQVPPDMKRRFARLAAMLEVADREFGRLINEYRQYRVSAGFHHNRSVVDAKIDQLRIVLRHAPRDVDVAMRAAGMAFAVGRHEDAVAILDRKTLADTPCVSRLLGIILTELRWDTPKSVGFRRGVTLLECCLKASPDDFEALLALAECEAQADSPDTARQLFQRASLADPSHPLVVCRYLEFEIGASTELLLKFASPMIRAAIDRARKLIDAGVNVPAVLSAAALLHLMDGRPFEALHAIARVIALCRTSRDDGSQSKHPCAAGRALQRTQAALKRLRSAAGFMAGFDWFERFLNLGLVHLLDDADAWQHLRANASSPPPAFDPAKPVLILAGVCVGGFEEKTATFGRMLAQAAEGTAFNLISGGTRAGVSGLAGDLAAASNGRTTATGYLPAKLPWGSTEDTDPTRFARLCPSRGIDFTPLEPLQAWTDLIVAGFDPRQIRVLCYAPGEIARAEISIALGLGARVGIVIDPDLPPERSYDDGDWSVPHEFLPLPYDLQTVRAFLHVETRTLDENTAAELEIAAKGAHDAYLASARPTDPSQKKWNDLDPALKNSNFQQVAFWKEILRRHGLDLVPITEEQANDPRRPLLDMNSVLSADQLDALAQLEHGRWNVERLAYGWRHGKQKDVAARISPYLIPWDMVPEDIQQYDVNAILALPANFRKAHLEIRQVPDSKANGRKKTGPKAPGPAWRS